MTPQQSLLAHIRPDDQTLWSILEELIGKNEQERKRILRPHDELAFTDTDETEAMEQRRRMDNALGALTLFEFGVETGLLVDAGLPAANRESLTKLFRSEAVLRYANAYLYFGVRMLCGRLDPPWWLTEGASINDHPDRERTRNERPFALIEPPPLNDPNAGQWAQWFLALPGGGDIDTALRFLDGFVQSAGEEFKPGDGNKLDEAESFDLWLRGLRPETDRALVGRFTNIAKGLEQWAVTRASFYVSLQRPAAPSGAVSPEIGQAGSLPTEWRASNPITARFGLMDVYWITRLFRADVSADARVAYQHTSWLRLLAMRAAALGDDQGRKALSEAEEVLRAVFDFTCDLIQNAMEITTDFEQRAYCPELFRDLPATTARWRRVFDEEWDEIERERNLRQFRIPSPPVSREPDKWSQRFRTGRHPHHLIGLALSGGGIRSATFALGVLQGLQEFDLLGQFDYISTVSGGGFIGSWLVANVRWTSHWLGRLTRWDEAISHLRRYSRYLAPNTGILSADTWAMWFSWVRNAFLIQLTAATWMMALVVLTLGMHKVFLAAGEESSFVLTAALLGFTILVTVVWNLRWAVKRRRRAAFGTDLIRLLAVAPAWIAAFLLTSLMWASATGRAENSLLFAGTSGYADVLKLAFIPWIVPIALSVAALTFVAFVTSARGRLQALWIGPVSGAAMYLQICAMMYLFLHWSSDPDQCGWFAFVFGPALLLATSSITVSLFIGFCGRWTAEWMREWWTRFGSWVAMFGAVFVVIGAVSVFGPLLILQVRHWTNWKPITTAAAWVGTVISGILSGKSSKTNGQNNSRGLDLLAKAGGVAFIAGAAILLATIVRLVLVNLADSGEAASWSALSGIGPVWIAAALMATVVSGLLFSWAFEINIFGLSHFYRNRLTRCYLGAARWAPGVRHPHPFTGFDQSDDIELSSLRNSFRGPFPIVNCSLNLGGSSDLSLNTRHSSSFSLTPLRCGADRPLVGYAPTDNKGQRFAGGVDLGQAMAVSGAAVSPNMGYNTSPVVAFLLTMFNVRLGWWFPNPGRKKWTSRRLRSGLGYLVAELFGIADETRSFVNVSDGGHFENLGIYELVRRRAKVIVTVDGECDEKLQFGSLGNLVRICDTDFGAKIDLDVSSIRLQENGLSQAHGAIGRIVYSTGSTGWLIYLKATMTGDEDVGVAEYKSTHPSFPHETTADQFFSEDQFESYRRLGQHIVQHVFRSTQPGASPVDIAERLWNSWVPRRFSTESFLKHTETLNGIWQRFRDCPPLHKFLGELMESKPTGSMTPSAEELTIGLEMLQLMEDVFLDIRLDDYWEHPDNRGWAALFTRWSKSPLFRAIWAQTKRSFGIRFEYFCRQRLGLPSDSPIFRVS